VFHVFLFDKRLPKIINYRAGSAGASGPVPAAFSETSPGFTLFNGPHIIFGKDIESSLHNYKNHIT
jgi:hypothetical protein